MEFSVIIPCFNKEKYIQDCISSVMQNDFDDFEVICIDDGSSDNSVKILNELAHKYQNLVIIHQNHLGSSQARNAGIKAAKGKWITFLDADDLFFDNALNIFHNVIKCNNADIIIADYSVFKNDLNSMGGGIEQILQTSTSLKSYNIKDGFITKDYFFKIYIKNSHFAIWAKLYNAKFLQNHNICFLDDVFMADDLYFNTLAFYFAKNIIKISNNIVAYRLGENNLSRTKDVKHIQDMRKIAQKLENFNYIYIKALSLRLKYEIVLNLDFKQNFYQNITKLPFCKEFYLLSLRFKTQVFARILLGKFLYSNLIKILRYILKHIKS